VTGRDAEIRRSALEQRIRIAEQDLEDLARQVEEGEIDDEAAAGLEEGYRAELEAARAELGELPAPRKRPTPKPKPRARAADAPAPAGPSGRKVLIVAVAALVVLTVSIVLIARSGDPGPAEASPTIPTDTESLDDTLAQMEAALATQPDNNAMRLALAGIYFENGDYMNAMNHYSTVTASDPTPEQAAVAQARIGWMAWVALNDPETALQFLDAAIEVDPTYGEAKLWKGVVILYGTDDPAAAVPLFEEVLGYPDLPDEIRPEVEAMLEEARGGGS
jgi:cytochrome c-type biogenesis protein CcmH/NrfG